MLAGALELFLVSLGLTYYIATVGGGLRVLRRASRAGGSATGSAGRPARHRRRAARTMPGRGSLAAARLGRIRSRLDTAEEPPGRASVLMPPEDCVVYFIVPCLNEELVIADTARSLLADSRALVVVVDDASDDRTGELAAAVDADRVMVIRRELPEARLGTGPALNAGFAKVLQDAGVRGIAASRITVCVMDADGRLSDGAVAAVLPLLADQRVGGVQLPVRIRNRNSLLAVMQDLEFWGVCAVAQLGRMASGTVSLGGNGQFTRLAALLEMGPSPWQAQLATNLDLSLALAAKGWRLTSCPDACVSQPGVTSLRALASQRTRRYQGHMRAVRWLRELWSSRQLSHLAMLELTIYLMVPWALVLPWSIIFNYNLLIMVLWILGWVATPGLGADVAQKVATLVLWYTLSCLPIYMAGFLYGRQERKVGYLRAFFIGHLLLVGNYVTYAACWRAVYRLITRSRGWEKTRRTDERRAVEPVSARPAPAPAPAPALSRPPAAASSPLPPPAPAFSRAEIQPAAQPLVPGRQPPAGLAEADDDATTTGIAAVREPVLAAVGGHRKLPRRASGPASGRHAVGGAAAPRERAAQGSHRAGRSRSGDHPRRPAR